MTREVVIYYSSITIVVLTYVCLTLYSVFMYIKTEKQFNKENIKTFNDHLKELEK